MQNVCRFLKATILQVEWMTQTLPKTQQSGGLKWPREFPPPLLIIRTILANNSVIPVFELTFGGIGAKGRPPQNMPLWRSDHFK